MLNSAYSSPVIRLLLLLSVYFWAAGAASVSIRQVTGTDSPDIDCDSYSSIANLSTIGSNSTYRAAFLRSTTDGTNKAASILNTAEAQLPVLINDVPLNEQCGNATAIALTEAANNFTNGIVAEFAIQPPVGVDATGAQGLITLIVVGLVICITCGTYSAL